jgi:hypothetical protein
LRCRLHGSLAFRGFKNSWVRLNNKNTSLRQFHTQERQNCSTAGTGILTTPRDFRGFEDVGGGGGGDEPTIKMFMQSKKRYKILNSSFFWDVTQRRLLKTDISGPISSPKTSLFNNSTLRNIPEDGRIHFN